MEPLLGPQQQPPFPPNPTRARIERMLGCFFVLVGAYVGRSEFNHGLGMSIAIGLLVFGLTLIAIADTRTYGPPPATLSFRSPSYPFVWLAYALSRPFVREKDRP